MQCSLVPRIAWPRLRPSSAAQPEPGSRLLHGETPSRKYEQRTRWRRLPPIEAMLRSCCEAPRSSACETAGKRSTTAGARATSLIRASAPMRTPPSRSSSTSVSGSALMSTSRSGRSTSRRMRSTSVVPPARNALVGSALTIAIASSTSKAR
jgi:hypothetical protein